MARHFTGTQKLAAALLAVVVVFWFADFGLCFLERRERLIYAGWLLQIAALALIFFSIANKERSVYGVIGWWNTLVRLWPRRRRNVVVGVTGVSALVSVASGDAEGWIDAPKDATDRQRIEALEANVKMLRASAATRHEQLQRITRQHAQALAQEKAERIEDARKLRAETKAAAGDDIRVGYWNVVLLFIGITAATVPDFVLVAFGWVYRWAPIVSCWRS